MPTCVKRDIQVSSSDGEHTIYGRINHANDAFCVLQLSHGMCEHIGRYDELAGFLADNGVVFCAHDHLGHGASVNSNDELGYFGAGNSRRYCLDDMHKVNMLV